MQSKNPYFKETWDRLTTSSTGIVSEFKSIASDISNKDDFNLCEELLRAIERNAVVTREVAFELNYFFYTEYDKDNVASQTEEEFKLHLWESIDFNYGLESESVESSPIFD